MLDICPAERVIRLIGDLLAELSAIGEEFISDSGLKKDRKLDECEFNFFLFRMDFVERLVEPSF